MDILNYLKQRGIINNISDEVKFSNAIKNGKAIYIGFDPSFKSFHLGNYIQIHLLNIFHKFGIKTFAIIGGATGKIGDPSGKKAERTLLSNDVIQDNILALTKQLQKLTKAEILNNFSWYQGHDLFDFLRDVGKYFSINYLLEKDTIKSRLETGISFAEVTYNLIQGYDFYWLYENKDVAIQVGGADQWGNITTGLELIRKYHDDKIDVAGLTINLLTKSDGSKFGKSEKGAIYLDDSITSVFEMYQFFINQSDDDLRKLFMFFSDLEITEIDSIINKHNLNKKERYGQKKLANEIISAIHGQEAFEQCEKIAFALYNEQINTLSQHQLDICIKQLESYQLAVGEIKIVDFLLQNKIFPSKRVIREFINSNALKVNDKIITDENFILSKNISLFNKYIFVKKGKKNYIAVIFS